MKEIFVHQSVHIMISGLTTVILLSLHSSKHKHVYKNVSVSFFLLTLNFFGSYSNSSIYDHYMSSEEEDDEIEHNPFEEGEEVEEEEESIIEDVKSHDIWKGKL